MIEPILDVGSRQWATESGGKDGSRSGPAIARQE
jgi:hypothetical protein